MGDRLLVQVDAKILEPSDSEKRRIRIWIGLPSQAHNTNCNVVRLGAFRWSQNPVVVGIGGERELPIGGGYGQIIITGVGVDVPIRFRGGDDPELTTTLERLRSGQWSLAATVLVEKAEGTEWEGELVSINVVQAEDRTRMIPGDHVAHEHVQLDVGGLEPNKVWLLLGQNQTAENGVYIVDKNGFLKRAAHALGFNGVSAALR